MLLNQCGHWYNIKKGKWRISSNRNSVPIVLEVVLRAEPKQLLTTGWITDRFVARFQRIKITSKAKEKTKTDTSHFAMSQRKVWSVGAVSVPRKQNALLCDKSWHLTLELKQICFTGAAHPRGHRHSDVGRSTLERQLCGVQRLPHKYNMCGTFVVTRFVASLRWRSAPPQYRVLTGIFALICRQSILKKQRTAAPKKSGVHVEF